MKILPVLVQPTHLFVIVAWILNLQNTSCYSVLAVKNQGESYTIYWTAFSDSSLKNTRLKLSEALLLAPKTDLVTKKDNIRINEALFEFLADT